MRLRDEQIQRLERTSVEGFVSEMLVHLREFAPELGRLHQDAVLRSAIRSGIDAAARHRFTNRGPVRLFLELQWSLGSEFDSDPQLPWAARILRMRPHDQSWRAEVLHEHCLEYFEIVNGPDDDYAIAALRKAAALPLEAPASARGLTDCVGRMMDIYPEKALYVGADALATLASTAQQIAGEFGPDDPACSWLAAALMLGFGHGVFRDPLYGWVQRTLNAAECTPLQRFRNLHRHATVYAATIVRRSDRNHAKDAEVQAE